MIVTTIVVVGLGGLMLAANWMLTPLKQDAEAAREVQGELENLGWLAKGSKVIAVSRKGGDENKKLLYRERDWGVTVRLSPRVDVFRSDGRLVHLAQRVVETVSQKGARGNAIRWVEIALEYNAEVVIRTLYVLDPETGRWGNTEGRLPDRWQPEGGFPAE
jgi:hypothetical protein